MSRTIRAIIFCLLPAASRSVNWQGLILLPVFIFGGTAYAHETVDVEARYRELQTKVLKIHAAKGHGVARKLEDRKTQGLAASPGYQQLKKDLHFWETIFRLKMDLKNRYLQFHPEDGETKMLDEETSRLAYGLIEGIEKMRRGYKIGTFPIVHNLFIQVHLKKRGACKHWAEDLLALLDKMDHPHFTALWAEAHPGSIREHNVAVLTPKGTSYKEGLVIDPWRTAGKPFWIPVKDDSHPWQQWSGYEAR